MEKESVMWILLFIALVIFAIVYYQDYRDKDNEKKEEPRKMNLPVLNPKNLQEPKVNLPLTKLDDVVHDYDINVGDDTYKVHINRVYNEEQKFVYIRVKSELFGLVEEDKFDYDYKDIDLLLKNGEKFWLDQELQYYLIFKANKISSKLNNNIYKNLDVIRLFKLKRDEDHFYDDYTFYFYYYGETHNYSFESHFTLMIKYKDFYIGDIHINDISGSFIKITSAPNNGRLNLDHSKIIEMVNNFTKNYTTEFDEIFKELSTEKQQINYEK